ncbi:unnamed protein product [Prorocentrum cordatum]|uniref:Protein ZIP4 homolog n=1 Tax=Prorocentrum cordatum TaxID=2364126 RepID=A0ABN9VXG0_9DINO|nr:unnamed protein product [Polarella glacialis]
MASAARDGQAGAAEQPPEASFAAELEGLVAGAEAALARGRAPDVSPAALASVGKGIAGATVPPLTLKRAGSRLWQVCCGAAAAKPAPLLAGAPAAGARELACELIEAGMSQSGIWPSRDHVDLILQWAVAGKAWLDLRAPGAAVRCLTRSGAASDAYARDDGPRAASVAESDRLLEASLQAQLWMAEALALGDSHDQAFVALSKACQALRGSPALVGSCRGTLLRECRRHAARLRKLGDSRRAIDVLTLACTMLPPEAGAGSARAQPERAELLRQVVPCHADLGEHATAMARAREAVRLETRGSTGHARSLRAMLGALCAPGAASADRPTADREALEATLEFVAHERAKAQDCLDVCRELADHGLDATCLRCLSRLRARLGGNLEELGSAWLFCAQLLANRVEEGGESLGGPEQAVDRLCELLDEVEACPERPSGLPEKFAQLLWGLGGALCRRGQAQAAAMWMNRALPFLTEQGRVAAGWRALAACHREAGELDQARRCADTALAHEPSDAPAAVFVLLDALRRGEAELVGSLLARASSQEVILSVGQMAYVVQEAGKQQPPSAMLSDCLELLLRIVSDDAQAAEEAGVTQQRVLRTLLETCEARGEPASRLAQHLGSAAALRGLPENEAGWFLEFAWQKATGFAEQRDWSSSVSMFKCAHELVARCGGTAADEGRCAAALCQALLQQAGARAGEGGAAEARDLRQRARLWATRGRSGLVRDGARALGAAGAATDQALARFQFEAACHLRELPSGAGLDELLAVASTDPEGAALLARVALEAGDAELAARCLRRYLRLAAREGGFCPRRAAAARRELAGLRVPGGEDGEELGRACEEALELLRAKAGVAASGAALPDPVPHEEALWLALQAWNVGAEVLVGAGSSGEAAALAARRMRQGLALLGVLARLGALPGRGLGDLHCELCGQLAVAEPLRRWFASECQSEERARSE